MGGGAAGGLHRIVCGRVRPQTREAAKVREVPIRGGAGCLRSGDLQSGGPPAHAARAGTDRGTAWPFRNGAGLRPSLVGMLVAVSASLTQTAAAPARTRHRRDRPHRQRARRALAAVQFTAGVIAITTFCRQGDLFSWRCCEVTLRGRERLSAADCVRLNVKKWPSLCDRPHRFRISQ